MINNRIMQEEKIGNKPYQLLTKKLNAFIQKYYLNMLIRGILLFLAFVFLFYLLLTVAESFFYFNTIVRKVFFFGYISLLCVLFTMYICIPVFKLFRIGKILSFKQAAHIIQRHFSSVEDKIVNVLQLQESALLHKEDLSLIVAGIEQKSKELQYIPFLHAIDLKRNKKYTTFLFPVLIILSSIFLISPNVLKESTKRIFFHNVQYEKPLPYEVSIINDKLEVTQYDDFTLLLHVKGSQYPEIVSIARSTGTFQMSKLSDTIYSYTFTSVQKNELFAVQTEEYVSPEYILKANQKPIVNSISIVLDYPEYTGIRDEIKDDAVDLIVPIGTISQWMFSTENVDEMYALSKTKEQLEKDKYNAFILNKKLIINELYNIKYSNIYSSDSFSLLIRVVEDAYPTIYVDELQDSIYPETMHYIGEVSDDYGIKNVYFHYSVENMETHKQENKVVPIPVESGTKGWFSFVLNMGAYDLKPGDMFSYYFQVWDNDAYNGSKSSQTKTYTHQIPTIKEYEQENEQQLHAIKQNITQLIKDSENLKKEVKELQQDILEKENIGWEEKKMYEEIAEKQERMQEEIEKMASQLEKNRKHQETYKEVSEEVRQKYEQLETLFEEVIDDDMKALMEQLEKMMEQLTKEDMLDELNKMEYTDQEIEKEMDRMLALLKKLEFEQKLSETIDKLEKLAENQKDLSEQTKEGEDVESLYEDQKEIEEEFSEIKEDVQEMQEMNEAMDDHVNMEESEEQMSEIDHQMQQANEQLQKNKTQKASDHQKNSSDQMQEMAENLSNMMMSMQAQETTQNLDAVRQILENLVTLSFDQEALMKEIRQTHVTTPKYVELIQKQYKIWDDSKLVEDSLFALAKKVFEIEAVITDEIMRVNQNLDKSIDYLENRKVNDAQVPQQYVMTGYNELALLLSEIMQQMQQQMAMQMQGNQMCQKPGSNPNSGTMPSIKSLQQQLNDQINKMGEMMKEGNKLGEKGISKEIAKMAAKQQAIRQALESINHGNEKEGKESIKSMEEAIHKMEQTEEELVNKQITQELINRQQDIMTRLLEAEKSIQERDQKEERTSTMANQTTQQTPPNVEEYIKNKERSLELYKEIPPSINTYYKKITEKYFRNVSNTY